MGAPPFPYRGPGQPWPAYRDAVSRWLNHPATQMAAYRRAVGSGHSDGWRDLGDDCEPATWWPQTLSEDRLLSRRLRAYLSWRLAGPTAAPEPPRGADDLDATLVASVNALGSAESAETLLALSGPGIGLVLAGLRERGAAVLAARPDLAAVLPGPPVAVSLDGDVTERSEVERLAPGTAPGSPEQVDALVEAALRGDLNVALLPQHLLVAVRAALLERIFDTAVQARLPAAANPDADPERDLLVDLLTSPETQAAAAMLRAALDGVATVLAPGGGGYGNGG